MKNSAYYLLWAALAVCAFWSCNKSDDNKSEEQPSLNHYTYDGVQKEIKTAAYYLQGTDGYNIVFSAQQGVTDFRDESNDLFSIDMPYEKTGMKLDFATDQFNGAAWDFYMCMWDAASEAGNYWEDTAFQSGTIQVLVSEDGTFEIHVDAVSVEGKTLKVEYKGRPQKKDDYIWVYL